MFPEKGRHRKTKEELAVRYDALQNDAVLDPSSIASATIGFSFGSIFLSGPHSWEEEGLAFGTFGPLNGDSAAVKEILSACAVRARL